MEMIEGQEVHLVQSTSLRYSGLPFGVSIAP
jgi:hypothetical protein